MRNIVLCPSSIEELIDLSRFSKVMLIGLKGYTYLHEAYFDEKDLESIYKLKEQLALKIILRLDLMMHNSKIEQIRNFIKENNLQDVLFYTQDLGIINIGREMNIINKFIYDPLTLITNHLDAKFYADLGLDAYGVSLEIPFKDAVSCNPDKMFYQVFGYRQMFESKRKVISLYKEHSNLVFDNGLMYLKEANREDYYPVFEDDNGTYIYRSYLINLIKHIKEAEIKYMYFSHININNKDYYEVIRIYSEYLNDSLSLNVAEAKLNNLGLTFSDGFTYKDSVYQKEELKNE